MLKLNKKQPAFICSTKFRAFTIVELLVVIVLIAILATITIVSYTGITNRANAASLSTDLINNSKLLELYYTEYGSYPTEHDSSNCPTLPYSDSKYCLKSSNNNVIIYNASAQSFNITASNNNTYYTITNNSSPTTMATATSLNCPSGFIPVPGSSTYNTNDFCVMKYEAKNAGSNVPVSQASGTPWINISQNNAITYSSNVSGCTGCHIITEAEWMTIAQNVLSVAGNWSGGVVGSGYIYSGHNDNSPTNSIAASTNDNDGYYNTNNSTGNQKRTLALSNGEIIWDFTGNAWEWTSGQTTGGQPGITGESSFGYKEWTAVTTNGSLIINPFPNNIGLYSASNWDSNYGIGRLYSHSGDTFLRGFLRGGGWYVTSNAGVLALALDPSPGGPGTNFGFRVAK